MNMEPQEMKPVKISIKNITKVFGPKPETVLPMVEAGEGKADILAKTGHTVGLNRVSLDIGDGEIFVIMGLSGSGKSTLIRHFNRLIDPTAGEIIVDGKNIVEFNAKELEAFRQHSMSMVFQGFALMPHRTVVDNVAFGLEIQGVDKAVRLEKAKHWIERVGLTGYEDTFPANCSGGMQQRVGLARALCTDPEILLMDEAFSALDPLIRSEMQDQLVALQGELNKTIVFITHDLDEALRIGDKIAILKDGKLIQVGTPADILLKPADDYVEAFVRDVNRARALSVDVIMRPPKLRLTRETIDEAIKQMQTRGVDYGYYVPKTDFEGIITLEGLQQAKADGHTDLTHAAEDTQTVINSQNIEQAVPVALDCDAPVPVVDETGAFMGVVGSKEMARLLK